MSKRTNRAAYAKLDAIYARLPRMQCRGLCGDEVCGPVPMALLEAERLRRTAHEAPRTTPRMCVYLRDGRCRVYAVRPLICRVFGLVKRMSCPHGCVPDRWLSDYEFLELAQAIERIGGDLVQSAPDGLIRDGRSFLAIHPDNDRMPPELADHYAELTRGLRALHHGRIIGVTPTPTGEQPQWIDVDAPGTLEKLRR